MGHGVYKVFTASIASGGSLSSAIDLKFAAQSVYLEIQSLTTNADHYIQAAAELGGTYRRVFHPSVNSSPAGNNSFYVASALSSAFAPIPSGLRYIKIERDNNATHGATYKIHTADQGG